MIHSNQPYTDTPCSDDQLIAVLASHRMTADPDSVQLAVTSGPARVGVAIINVTECPPADHLDACSIVASMLAAGQHVHMLFNNQLVTMDGGT